MLLEHETKDRIELWHDRMVRECSTFALTQKASQREERLVFTWRCEIPAEYVQCSW